MNSQHEAGIKLTGDAQGAVDAHKQVAEEQKKLAEQTKRTTESAKAAAEESKRFVERLNDQAQTLGKTRAEVERYRAGQLQLTEAQRRSVDVSIRQIEAYDKKQQALRVVGRVAAAATVLLLVYSTTVIASTKSTIDQAAAVHNLSQTYGIATSALSAYRYQMGLAGVDNAAFGLGIKALAKNISEARGGSGDGATIFGLLGADIESAVRAGASMEELLPRIADRFASFADGPNKAALAMALFGGRVGEQLVPELNKGAEGFRAAAREAAEFGRIIGTNTARQAEEFNTQLARNNALLTASAFIITRDALPALNAYLEQLLEGRRIAGGYGAAIARFGTMNADPAAAIASASAGIGELEAARANMAGLTGYDGQIANIDAQLEAQRQRRDFALFMQRQAALRSTEGMDAGDSASRMLARTRSARGQAPGLPNPGAGDAAAQETARLRAQDAANWARSAEQALEASQELVYTWNAAGERVAITRQEWERIVELQKAGEQQLAQALGAGGMDGLVEATQELVAASEELVYTWTEWGERIAVTKRDFDEIYSPEARQDREIRFGLEQRRALDDQAAQSAKSFEQAVATGIMLGFRRGGGGLASNLRQVIENAIWTATLTPVATRIGGAFGGFGQALAGQGGPLVSSSGQWLATSALGQRMGWSKFIADDAGGGSFQPTSSFMSSFGSSIPYVGAAFVAAGALQNTESRYDFDSLARGYEAKLGMTGMKRAQFNPVGGYLAGDISLKELLASPPGLVRHKGDTRRAAGIGGGLGAPSILDTHWFGEGMESVAPYFQSIAEQEQNLLRNLNLSPGQLASVNVSLGKRRGYDFGMERTPWEQSEAFERIRADRLTAISQVLGRSIEELTSIMSMSAEQWAQAIEALQAQFDAAERGLGEHVRGLPGQLGISGLQGYLDSMAMGEDRSPLDRVGAGLDLFRRTRSRALAGELDAVRALPGIGGELFGIGREVYASGQGFQDLRSEIEQGVAEVLSRQETLQLETMRDVPLSIMEASRNEVEEIKKQTAALVAQFEKLRQELARLQQ